MKALRDQIKDSRTRKSADKPKEMVFLIWKDVNMREFEENGLYIDI
jgi:hypothetical protein